MKLLILALLLSGCGTTAHVGQYRIIGPNEYLGDGFPTYFTVEKPVTDRLTCKFIHQSHIAVGWPFGGEETDANMVGVEYKLW
jgi:hypothetical protein